MKRGWTKAWALLVVVAFAASLGLGCGRDKEEEKLQVQIQDQITLVDTQVKGLEGHQAKMREMIAGMQAQLSEMQKELDGEAPKLKAASDGVLGLRELTTVGFGETPAMETLKNPSYNVAWMVLFVLLLWVLYRVWHRRRQAQ